MYKITESLKCGIVYKHGKDSIVLMIQLILFLYLYFIKGIYFKDFCFIIPIVNRKLRLFLNGLNKIRKIWYK